MRIKIKICGITSPDETEFLNEYKPDYTGFVFYEKSKRNVTLDKACDLAARLEPGIKKVAVTVSPGAEEIRRIQEAHFADVIQIHKGLDPGALKAAIVPVWYAMNIEDDAEADRELEKLERLPDELRSKIKGIVADAPDFGSGHTFKWDPDAGRRLKAKLKDKMNDAQFILAGGLNPENVTEGIRIFKPDIVDVSSGVEKDNAAGKDRDKTGAFVTAVRSYERETDHE